MIPAAARGLALGSRVQGFMYLSWYNTGLYNKIQAVVPLCCTQKNKNKTKKLIDLYLGRSVSSVGSSLQATPFILHVVI